MVTMSKAHFEFLAKFVRELGMGEMLTEIYKVPIPVVTRAMLASQLCEKLAETNPKFDSERFLRRAMPEPKPGLERGICYYNDPFREGHCILDAGHDGPHYERVQIGKSSIGV